MYSIVKWLPFGLRGMTIPPLGIFIKNGYQNDNLLLEHETIHWKQYERYGLLGFYAKYFGELLKNGYADNALEIEARVESEKNICSNQRKLLDLPSKLNSSKMALNSALLSKLAADPQRAAELEAHIIAAKAMNGGGNQPAVNVQGNGTNQIVQTQRVGDKVISTIMPQPLTNPDMGNGVPFGWSYPSLDPTMKPYVQTYTFTIAPAILNGLLGLTYAGYVIFGGNLMLRGAVTRDLVTNQGASTASVGLPQGISAGLQPVFNFNSIQATLLAGYNEYNQSKFKKLKFSTSEANTTRYTWLKYTFQAGSPNIPPAQPVDTTPDAYQFQSAIIDLENQNLNMAENSVVVCLIPGNNGVLPVPTTVFSFFQ